MDYAPGDFVKRTTIEIIFKQKDNKKLLQLPVINWQIELNDKNIIISANDYSWKDKSTILLPWIVDVNPSRTLH